IANNYISANGQLLNDLTKKVSNFKLIVPTTVKVKSTPTQNDWEDFVLETTGSSSAKVWTNEAISKYLDVRNGTKEMEISFFEVPKLIDKTASKLELGFKLKIKGGYNDEGVIGDFTTDQLIIDFKPIDTKTNNSPFDGAYKQYIIDNFLTEYTKDNETYFDISFYKNCKFSNAEGKTTGGVYIGDETRWVPMDNLLWFPDGFEFSFEMEYIYENGRIKKLDEKIILWMSVLEYDPKP
ncbi:MAG: hypothetical protein ACRC4M_05060, partial [Mycoplasma sp.]